MAHEQAIPRMRDGNSDNKAVPYLACGRPCECAILFSAGGRLGNEQPRVWLADGTANEQSHIWPAGGPANKRSRIWLADRVRMSRPTLADGPANE